MAEPSEDVKKFFSRKLSSWQNALSHWRKKCQGVQEEHRKLQRSRDLVSERAPFSDKPQLGSPIVTRARTNATFSDALPPPKPSSSSLQTEERITIVGNQSRKCDEMLKRIENMISRLNHARTNGIWRYDKSTHFSIKKEKGFLKGELVKVERGEDIEVLKIEDDWLVVKNSTGAEGWVHVTKIMNELPYELTSTPGRQLSEKEKAGIEEDKKGFSSRRDTGGPR